MVEIALDAARGSFRLQIECRFDSEWTVVFGPSGSGKSTLLRILAGLDSASYSGRNRIALDGRVLTDSETGVSTKPGRRQMALVAQQPALFPHLSVEANVAYGLTALDRRSRAERVGEMLELVGATGLIHRRPRGLSGGEAQRVALARALALKPRLVLLDEPFSALDGAASDTLLDRLHDWVRDHNVQAVLCTHEASDAFATSAQVALLREGRLAALGPAAQVLAKERERLMQRLSK